MNVTQTSTREELRAEVDRRLSAIGDVPRETWGSHFDAVRDEVREEAIAAGVEGIEDWFEFWPPTPATEDDKRWAMQRLQELGLVPTGREGEDDERAETAD